MRDLGDRNAGRAITFCFFSSNSSGVPTSLISSGGNNRKVSVFKNVNNSEHDIPDNDVDWDADSYTGLNRVEIKTSDSFFESGKDYTVVVTGGTVGGTSVAGSVVATFSIENRQGGFFGLRSEVEENHESGKDNSTTEFWIAGLDSSSQQANNFFKDQALLWLSGDMEGLVFFITASTYAENDNASPADFDIRLTVQTMPEAPDTGDEFLILGTKGS